MSGNEHVQQQSVTLMDQFLCWYMRIFNLVTIQDTLSSRKCQKTDMVENTGIENIRIRERKLGSKSNSWEYRVITTGVLIKYCAKLNRVCN